MAVQPAVTNGLVLECDTEKFIPSSTTDCADVEVFAFLKFHFAVTDALWPIPVGYIFIVEEVDVVGVAVKCDADVVLVQFLVKGLAQSLDDGLLLVGKF